MLASKLGLWHMKVWVTQTILAQFAEILPQNGPVGAKHVVNGIVSLKI